MEVNPNVPRVSIQLLQLNTQSRFLLKSKVEQNSRWWLDAPELVLLKKKGMLVSSQLDAYGPLYLSDLLLLDI
jgi:hypothetical protein